MTPVKPQFFSIVLLLAAIAMHAWAQPDTRPFTTPSATPLKPSPAIPLETPRAVPEPVHDRVPLFNFVPAKTDRIACAKVLTAHRLACWQVPELEVNADRRGQALLLLVDRGLPKEYTVLTKYDPRDVEIRITEMLRASEPPIDAAVRATLRGNGCVAVVHVLVQIDSAQCDRFSQEDFGRVYFLATRMCCGWNGTEVRVTNTAGQELFPPKPGLLTP